MFLQYYINYQQDDWIDWLLAVEFQYNNKRHTTIGYIPFELNFGRYSWKEDLTVKIELPKLEDFIEGLQRSWEAVKNSINMAKKAMKKQFDRKRQNLQEFKPENNI